MEDLAGFGKIAEAILDKVAAVTGTLYEPTKVRKLGRAQADVEAELILKRTAAELEAEDMRRERQARLDPSIIDAEALKARTGGRLLAQELRRQQNLEQIVHDAATSETDGEPRAIEDDWMEAFLRYAQDISSEEVQSLWSRILTSQATESAPAVSRATLDALRLLEPAQAANFERAIQLLISMGQIMDVDPHGDPSVAFNVNALESLALEDIGFLKRIQEKEAGLGLVGTTLSFWNPIDFVSIGPDKMKTFWNDGTHLDEIVPKIKELSKGGRDLEGFRKETPIDRYILTSRGFELAAVIFDGFYDQLNATTVPDDTRLGAFSNREKREQVLTYWAEQFTDKGAAVVLNDASRTPDGKSLVVPKRLFEEEGRQWVNIS
jgi:hypothetical protein